MYINREHVCYIPHHVYEEKIIEVINPGPSDYCDNEQEETTYCHCCRRKKLSELVVISLHHFFIF